MRVALVSPYSWTYPGGVTRHIEALRSELDRAGHDVTVLAPFDPDRRRTALLHRGARPQVREAPEWLRPPRPPPRPPPPRPPPGRPPQRRGPDPRPAPVPRPHAAPRAARRRLRRRAPARAGGARGG